MLFINARFGEHPTSFEFLKQGGCPFIYRMTYDADFVRWLLEGEDPEEMYATGAITNS